METRPELVLLQKTMVVVEGVARRLDPEFDMWTTAEPVVSEWIERHLGAAGRLEEVASTAREIGRFVKNLPETLSRIDSAVDRLAAVSAPGLRLDEETVDQLAEARAGELYWSRWAIRIGVVALVIIAALAVF
jgi:ubiquinone biosynthesis protein